MTENQESLPTSGRDSLSERISSLSPEKQALLALRLKNKRVQSVGSNSITRRQDQQTYPLSHAQRRMWFLSQWEPESPFYNIPSIVRLEGDLNLEALNQSYIEIIQRHEVLRARFETENGQPVQIIEPHRNFEIPLIDLAGLSAKEREDRYLDILHDEANWVFDLNQGPLVHASLVRLESQSHVLFLTFHHIVSDGWSIGVFIREAALLYEAFSNQHQSPLSELPIQYADYAAWQQTWLQGEPLQEQLQYWKDKLGGTDVFLELPTDHPRPTVQTFNGNYHQFLLPENQSEGLRKLARQKDVTLFMVLLAAFQVLLYRYSGQEDIRIGTPVANRNRVEVEALIGLFVNTLVMRAEFTPDLRFDAFLEQVRETALGAYAHQDLPLEMLLDELKIVRDVSRTPLYQVMFALQDEALKSLNLPSLQIGLIEPKGNTAKFDLTLFMEDSSSGLKGTFEYNTDLFEPETIARMAESFQILLEGIIQDPQQVINRIPILSQLERNRQLFEWNETYSDYPFQKNLAELFETNVSKSPLALALQFPDLNLPIQDESLTYFELNQRANQLAHYLQKLGIGPDVLVGLYMERSLMMVVATLAIIKAGGAYLPLDLSYPVERLRYMLQDSKADIVITNIAYLEELIPVDGLHLICLDLESDQQKISYESKENPICQANGENLAYVMYTSGSTGKPKGVAILQRAVSRLVMNTNYIQINPTDRIAHASNPSFDAATLEIWGAFLNGAQLIGVTRETALSVKDYARYLKEKQIDILFLTTALFNVLAHEEPGAFSQLKYLLFGGEKVEVNPIRSVLKHGKPEHLINGYGPTESTTFATFYEIDELPEKALSVPIGKPLSNTQVYILDSQMEPLPVGVPGELYIGGDGLASGYINLEELTEAKFVSNPFELELVDYVERHYPGASFHKPIDKRLYKTGDRVRYFPDGNIDFIGRLDFQIKLRGLRIELGEIESSLGQYPPIKENIILLREDVPGDKRLVGYLVPNPGFKIDLVELRRFLKEKLPDFMVPSAFVILDHLPINQNGKVDRKALPAPDQSWSDLEKTYLPPRTAVEKYLVKRWQSVLNIERIGIYDDFFELGGDSLKAAVLMNRLQEELGGIAHVRALFMAPTVADLTLYMSEYYPLAIEKIQKEIFPTEFSGDEVIEPHVDGEIVAQDVKPALIDQQELRAGTTVNPAMLATIRQIIKPLMPRPLDSQIVSKKGFLPGGVVKNSPAVFVLSPPRSGSTLLRTMLAGNPHLFSPPELDLLSFNTLNERRIAFSGAQAFWLEGVERAIMELKGCDASQARQIMEQFEADGLSTKQFYSILQEWIAATLPGEKRLLVDKTPVYALDLAILNRAEEDFNRPFYIHLYRHPFASIYSFIEAKLDGVFFRYQHPFNQRELAELVWIISHQNILDFLATIPEERKLSISFEQMVSLPADEMQRVCNFLHIPFDIRMLKPYEGDRMTSGIRPGAQMVGDFKFYLRKDIDPKAADRWRKFFVDDTLSTQGWEIAEKLGYERIESVDSRSRVDPTHLTDASQNKGDFAKEKLWEITPISRTGEELPLSFAQQRLWFLDQWEPGSPYYNVPAAVRMRGRMNLQAMRQTLHEIIRRHEVLRTRFSARDGRPLLEIDAEVDLPLQVIDLREAPLLPHASEKDREARALQLAVEEARRPFNLASGPLIRTCIIQLDKEDNIVVLTMHHIVSDGWSAGVIIREIAALYNAYSQGMPSPLPELPIQYLDYAAWQRHWLHGSILDTQLAYWRRKLAGAPGLLELPTDRARPAIQTLRGARQLFELPINLFQELKGLSQREEVTLFMTMLAAFQVLLSRYSGQDDICVGTPIANRNRAEIEGLIGFFVNTLVLRSDLSGDPTFRKLLEHVKKTAIEAYDHQDLPFERLVDDLQPERDQSHTPLFQVMFTLQESSIQSLNLPGLTLTPVQLDSGTSKFDLILTMVDRGDVLKGVLEYNTDLFDPVTIDRMIGHYRVLLHGVVANPDDRLSELPILSDEEFQQLIVDWNRTILRDQTISLQENRLAGQTIDGLFEAQVELHPDNVAVIFKDTSLTYQELNQRANQLGRFLIKSGIGSDRIVGLCVERSLDIMVGILGILKAGGAYLPLDPDYPADRLAFILKDANVPVLLTQAHLKDELVSKIFDDEPGDSLKVICMDRDWPDIAGELGTNLRNAPVDTSIGQSSVKIPSEAETLARPENLAYVIYTSGSTGLPKGVLIEHRSAINLWLGLNQKIYINHANFPLRVSLNAPLPFDASVQEWLMLLSGHTLVVIPSEVRQDGETLYRFIQESRIDVLDCVPSQLKMLMAAGMLNDQFAGASSQNIAPQAVLPGGEAIDENTWDILARASGIEFYNMYGPTECTVDSTICQVSKHSQKPSIGRPIVNAQAYVLDRNLKPVPIGVPGELYLGGAGVGRGYWNRPELTAERFIANPFIKIQHESGLPISSTDRLYRTGDRVRFLPDGNLEYLGRIDFQVKLRGFRIELGEIESVLMQMPDIEEAIVIVREDTPGEKQLVAYLVPDSHVQDTQTGNSDFLANGAGPMSENEPTPGSPVNVSNVRNYLKSKLPDYMVPGVFVTLDSLPLTPNRKVDRRALPKPEGLRPELEAVYEAPRDERENLLVEIWQQVLKLDKVGIYDNFFDLGGDSILSIQVVSRASQVGLRLTPRQIFEAQTIEALARIAGTETITPVEQGLVNGPVELTPIQRAFFDQVDQNLIKKPNHWNQALLLEVRLPLQIDAMHDAIQLLLQLHDALRLRFSFNGESWEQVNANFELEAPFIRIDLSSFSIEEQKKEIAQKSAEAQAALNITTGPIIKVIYFDLGDGQPGRLFIAIHHLAIDGISWRILLLDLMTAYSQTSQGLPVQLPAKTTSFQKWGERLVKLAYLPEIEAQLDYWVNSTRFAQESGLAEIPVDFRYKENLENAVENVRQSLDVTETAALLRETLAVYQAEIGDVLLTALGSSLQSWMKTEYAIVKNGIQVTLEGHGREEAVGNKALGNIDITRTVGWFTSIYPATLTLDDTKSIVANLIAVKKQIRKIPQKGIGYGLLRYLNPKGKVLSQLPVGQVSFNYLGQVDQVLPSDAPFSPAQEPIGPSHDLSGARSHLIDLIASVSQGQLRIEWLFNPEIHRRSSIEKLAERFLAELKALIENRSAVELSEMEESDGPPDFLDLDLSSDEFDGLLEELTGDID